MKYTIEVCDYDHCIELAYEADAIIESGQSEYGETLLRDNKAGLITLAKTLLTLAQENVPSGTHVHMDEYNFLEDGSQELILVRWDNFENKQEKKRK